MLIYIGTFSIGLLVGMGVCFFVVAIGHINTREDEYERGYFDALKEQEKKENK